MQILQDKALVIPVVHPKQITSVIPKSKELKGEFLGRLVLGVEGDDIKVFGATIY